MKYFPADVEHSQFGLCTTKYVGYSSWKDVAQAMEPYEQYFDAETVRNAKQVWAFLQAHGLNKCPHIKPETTTPTTTTTNDSSSSSGGGMGYWDRQW
jgi:hypothetical protein